MNRQMRRITEKSEKKKEKEKADKIAARRTKVTAKRESRRAPAAPSQPGLAPNSSAPTAPTKPRNRFIGVLALVNIMVVVYGAFLTSNDPGMQDALMNGLLYVTLGYFLSRWFLGRGFGGRALLYSVLGGAALAFGLEIGKYALEGLAPSLLNLAFVLPALLLGAFGGVFIDRKLHGT